MVDICRLSRLGFALREAVAAQILPLVEWVVVALDRDADITLAMEHSHEDIALLVAVEDKLYIYRHRKMPQRLPDLTRLLRKESICCSALWKTSV